MEKAHLVAQPFQLIARQRREACQLSGSGGRDNERGLLTMVMPSPRREVTFAPLSRQGLPLGYSLFQKERAALSCKTSPVACKARVRQVKHGPILAWYLCLFVQQWSWRGRSKEN